MAECIHSFLTEHLPTDFGVNVKTAAQQTMIQPGHPLSGMALSVAQRTSHLVQLQTIATGTRICVTHPISLFRPAMQCPAFKSTNNEFHPTTFGAYGAEWDRDNSIRWGTAPVANG